MTRNRIKLRRLRRRYASQSPPVARTDEKLAATVSRLVAAETARIVPSDAEIDDAAEITDDDIDNAVSFWDESQADAATGLDGLLSARVTEE